MPHFHPDRAQIHTEVGGALAAGAAFSVAGGVISQVVATAGAVRLRVYIKTASAGGNLTVTPLRPGSHTSTYDTPLIAPTAVTAGTEKVVECEVYGEHGAVIALDPGGTGTVTYCDVSRT